MRKVISACLAVLMTLNLLLGTPLAVLAEENSSEPVTDHISSPGTEVPPSDGTMSSPNTDNLQSAESEESSSDEENLGPDRILTQSEATALGFSEVLNSDYYEASANLDLSIVKEYVKENIPAKLDEPIQYVISQARVEGNEHVVVGYHLKVQPIEEEIVNPEVAEGSGEKVLQEGLNEVTLVETYYYNTANDGAQITPKHEVVIPGEARRIERQTDSGEDDSSADVSSAQEGLKDETDKSDDKMSDDSEEKLDALAEAKASAKAAIESYASLSDEEEVNFLNRLEAANTIEDVLAIEDEAFQIDQNNQFTVDPVFAGDTVIAGRAGPGAEISVSFPDRRQAFSLTRQVQAATFATGLTANNGYFGVQVPDSVKIAQGDVLTVTARDVRGHQYTRQVTAQNLPQVNEKSLPKTGESDHYLWLGLGLLILLIGIGLLVYNKRKED